MVEDRRQVQTPRLPVRDRAACVQQIASTDHIFELAEAELRHDLAHLFGDEPEEVDHMLWFSFELLAQLWVLGRDSDRAGIQMTDAHHHAAHDDERRRAKAELLGPQQRADHNVAPGLHLTINLNDDPVAEVIQDQRLLGLREAELPWHAGVLDRGQRAGAGAAVVTADQHHVRLGLRHPGCDGAHTDFRY